MNLKINLSAKTPWRRPSNRFALSGVMSSLWSTVTYTDFMILVLKGKEKTCLLDRLWKIIAKNTTRITANTTLNAIPTFFPVEELRDLCTAGISVTLWLLQRNSNTIIRLVPTVRVKQTSMNNTDHSRWRHAANLMSNNRPFYRYGGHIELIRFKEYYRMPRGHEHISYVFSSAFRDIFS